MPARISTLMRRRALASSLAAGAVSGAARRDEMLDDITLYWLTNTAGSSARLYWENNNNNFNAVEQKTAEISTHMPMFEYTARRAGTSPPGRSRSCSQESFGLPSNHFASW